MANFTPDSQVNIVESIEQMTLPAAETITPGQAVRIDTAAGKFTKSNGTTADEARTYGVATGWKDIVAGEPVTAVKRGVLDGCGVTGLAYDAAVYVSDTDGALADAAGTVSKVAGRVIPSWSQMLGTSPDKLLLVDL